MKKYIYYIRCWNHTMEFMGIYKKLILFGNTLEEARNHFCGLSQPNNNKIIPYDSFEYTGKREYISTGQYNEKNRLILIAKYPYVFDSIYDLVVQREPHEIEEVNYMVI